MSKKAAKKNLIVKDRSFSGVGDGWSSVMGSFNPIAKFQQEGDSVIFVPTKVHQGKALDNGKESWLVDGTFVSGTVDFIQRKKEVQVKEGQDISIGVSTALMENEKTIGYRLLTEDGEPSQLLKYCMDNEEQIMIIFTGLGEKKRGRNPVKIFDIRVKSDVAAKLK